MLNAVTLLESARIGQLEFCNTLMCARSLLKFHATGAHLSQYTLSFRGYQMHGTVEEILYQAHLRRYVMFYPLNYADFVSLSINCLVGSHVKGGPETVYEKKLLFLPPLIDLLGALAAGSAWGIHQVTGL